MRALRKARRIFDKFESIYRSRCGFVFVSIECIDMKNYFAESSRDNIDWFWKMLCTTTLVRQNKFREMLAFQMLWCSTFTHTHTHAHKAQHKQTHPSQIQYFGILRAAQLKLERNVSVAFLPEVCAVACRTFGRFPRYLPEIRQLTKVHQAYSFRGAFAEHKAAVAVAAVHTGRDIELVRGRGRKMCGMRAAMHRHTCEQIFKFNTCFDSYIKGRNAEAQWNVCVCVCAPVRHTFFYTTNFVSTI